MSEFIKIDEFIFKKSIFDYAVYDEVKKITLIFLASKESAILKLDNDRVTEIYEMLNK